MPMYSEFAAMKCIVAAILFCICLRLLGLNADVFRQPTAPAGFWEQEQGSLLRPTHGSLARPDAPEEPPLFSRSDADLVQIKYSGSLDVWELLQKEQYFDLSGQAPKILILHTHGTECYTFGPGQTNFRTTNAEENMIAVGKALTEALEKAGISVLHDTTLHDYPAYSGAYDRSRETVERYLREFPSIRLVLDLHRDAAHNADGTQFAPTVLVDAEETAPIMFVVGTEGEQWQENLALGVKLQALLEKKDPGITRKTLVKDGRYNQDLSAGAILIEFGTAGNTLEQVFRAVPKLADAIIELSSQPVILSEAQAESKNPVDGCVALRDPSTRGKPLAQDDSIYFPTTGSFDSGASPSLRMTGFGARWALFEGGDLGAPFPSAFCIHREDCHGASPLAMTESFTK